jgi:hypothetical protein
MKNLLFKIILSFTLIMTFTTTSFSQVYEEGVFWMKVLNPSLNSTEGNEFSANTTLNSLFSSHNVTSYEKSYPSAKTPELLKFHEIKCDSCDVDSLINELSNQFSNDLTMFYRPEVENNTVYDPADNMWQLTINDTNNPYTWLWYLKITETDKAWDITRGDSTIKVAIIDFDVDITHPDLVGKIVTPFDPYDSVPFGCSPWHGHGTGVAGFAGAETVDAGTTPNGQLASAGYKNKVVMYNSGNRADVLKKALHASNVMGAKIITSCAGGSLGCGPIPGTGEEMVVKEILNNGTSIIMPAGNGLQSTWCNPDPRLHKAFYPFNPIYDDRIIIVTGSDSNDNHKTPTNPNRVHSHYPAVDFCAPGHDMIGLVPTNCGANTWPYLGGQGGTSFATPLVSSIATLVLSVNPCLSPRELKSILKYTTDSINDAHLFGDSIGTGRINSYKAVLAAQGAYSQSLDLYIKDRNEDFGNEVYPYHWQADRYDSPDIWVRNQNDGRTNQVHQRPKYNSSQPVYVYVRVRNKSCSPSIGTEKLNVYWSKSSSFSSWPQNWDGTQPLIGNSLGAFNVGILPPGKDTILEILWHILNPNIYNNWNTCLMARIENAPSDPITIHPNRIDDDVFYNNSVAMRNLTIVDNFPGVHLPVIDGVQHPLGSYLFIGNSTTTAETFDVEFTTPDVFPGNSIIDEAEVTLYFDETGWNIIESHLLNRDDIDIVADRTVLLKEKKVLLEDIYFQSETRIPVYIGFSFLTDELSEKNVFKYHIRQFLSNADSIVKVGEEHYEIRRYDRDIFSADAGDDQEIIENENTDLHAKDISEPATYNWYNSEDSLIYSGKDFTVSPEVTEKYKLEVIANSDGTKDYDEVIVKVKDCYISAMSPNPATNMVTVDYKVKNITSAYIMVLNTTATSSNNYIINVNQNKINFNVSSYTTGSYSVILVCDGKAVDMKTLIVQ